MSPKRCTQVVVGAMSELGKWIIQTLEDTDDFQVMFATDDGLDCLAAVDRIHPGLVILGSELRKLDAVELVWQVKKMHQAPKCLVLSRWPRLSQQFTLAGADRCLAIPCAPGALLRCIGSIMEDCALVK